MKEFLHDLIPGIKLARKILSDDLKTLSYKMKSDIFTVCFFNNKCTDMDKTIRTPVNSYIVK